LATSRQPRFASGDLSSSLGAIAFPVHVWAIVNILVMFPAWLLRASLWELAGAVSYPLVDALLESCLLWLVFVLLGFVLPRRWLADKFVALSSALAWLLAAWAMVVQFIYSHLLQWSLLQLLPGLLLVVFSFALVYWLVQRFGRLEGWIRQAAKSLVMLAYIYLAFDLLGLVVVILRNI
jgi:hypothetical protein